MSGWLKIHRKLRDHWIWENPDYLKWWLDILIEANHHDSKVLIKGTLYECKRGQKLYSITTWSQRWKCSKSKADRFLKMLEKDNMIVLKSETVTTLLTVCNYDTYQQDLKDSETQLKRKRNATETQLKPIEELNKDNKKELEARKQKFYDSLKPYLPKYGKETLRDFYSYWTEENKSGTQFKMELEKTWSTERRLTTWVKNDSRFGFKKPEPKKSLGI